MASRILSSLIMLAATMQTVESLYFYLVGDGTARCFLEELPPETSVVGKYKNPDFVSWGSPGFTGMGVKYEIKDPADAIIKSSGCDNEGRFAFTSAVGGEYKICFSTNATRYVGGRRFRVDLKIDVGEMSIDYAEAAKLEHLTSLEVELRRLNNKLKDMMREQAYQKEREVAFRATSESTNSRVVWWSIAQALTIVISGCWQISHLTAFFKSKKVV